MRIGIDYRILAVGSAGMTRGMGRFTQQQLAAVLDIDKDNEYALLCRPRDDLELIRPDIREADNAYISCMPVPTDGSPTDDTNLLRRAEEYQGWLYRTGIDLYHATTPFLFQDPALVDFDVCPMVATFYDVIPLVFPAEYLARQAEHDNYLRALGLLRRASRLIAISHAARQDALIYLGIAPTEIRVAKPFPDSCFKIMPDELVATRLGMLRERIRLPQRFVLTVSHLHHTKNLDTLLSAYAQLTRARRVALPLVVCCDLDDLGKALLRDRATALGIEDDVVPTGFVSDEELAALYNAATLVVHPSRYEGFGLPVAEAMACGSAVVTTTTSSLPEVAGDAAVLVEPDDADAMAEAIESLAHDSARRADMRERGLAQAMSFGPVQLAEATLATYQDAADPGGPSPAKRTVPRRPRLAIWTPLPPQQTGVADYSVELIEGLSPTFDVEVFVDDGFLPEQELLMKHRVHYFGAFARRASQQPFDAIIYEVGGSIFHLYMYGPLEQHRGIVVLHDLVWSNVAYVDALNRNNMPSFVTELSQLEGAEAGPRFERLSSRLGKLEPAMRERALLQFLCEHPMLGRIVNASTVQVTHSPEAASELAARFPAAKPVVVPMGVTDPRTGHRRAARDRARMRLRVSPDTFVIGVFGIIHESKRLEACVRALAEMITAHPDTLLVVVGRTLDERYRRELDRLATSLGVTAKICFTGHVSREDYDTYLVAVDAVINLRSTFVRNTSASLARAIAAGRAVIVSEHPDNAFLTDDDCLRVPAGPREVAVLTQHLTKLALDPELRRRLGESARSLHERTGTIEAMISGYARALALARSTVDPCTRPVPMAP